MFALADNIVLKRIKQALGFDDCKLFLFGAAPLKQTSIDYFASLNMPLFNCYGLSETTGSSTTNYMFNFSLSHCGKAFSGAHIKIANPDEKGEGEIIMYGRHIMMGYLKNDQAT